MTRITAVGPVTNGATTVLEISKPYIARVRLVGTADLLFHRWNAESVEAKSKAAKGSAAKKTDDVETYVYRADNNQLAIPGEYLRRALIHAAKFRQDPRSPRKSAMDLFQAGVVTLTALAPLGIETWDYEHRARVTIQRSAITRVRPAIKAGWTTDFDFLVNLPEYIPPDVLHDVCMNAGRLVGLADFRPTYGRFRVGCFDVLSD